MARPFRLPASLGLATVLVAASWSVFPGLRGGTCKIAAWSAGARTQPLAREAAIARMVSEVSADRLKDTIDQFMNVGTRFSPTSGCRIIGTSIYNYLSRLPLPVVYDEFRYVSARAGPLASGRNVIATLPGVEQPERVIIVGAHYDSTSDEPWRSSPGADDNASGTAAVLEIARILSTRRFSLTVRLIAFDAEELGTFGSEHVAAGAKARKEQVVGVLNLDMVGYDARGKRGLAVVPDRRSEWLADRFIEAAGTFGGPARIVKRVNVRWARGDQANFWAVGYPAIDVIEDMPDSNPYYHTKRDTLDTLDIPFLAGVTRATLATVADLAQLASRSER